MKVRDRLNYLKYFGIIGTILSIAGSFLPWERMGDPVSYWTYGIQLFPKVIDNGGVLVILLTLIIVLLTFQTQKIVVNPKFWSLFFSMTLMVVSLAFLIPTFFRSLEYGDAPGAPTLMIGLISVVAGSALLFWMSVLNYRQK